MSVLVLVESEGGAASETSRETLTFARQFGEPIHVVVVGDVPAGLDEYAVDVVHQAPASPSYAPAAWAAAVVAASPGARVVMASGTPRGGDVSIRLQPSPPSACIMSITDSGPGIPALLRPVVFERFARGDSARSKRTGGAGLGLAICAAIVSAHKGTITIDDGVVAGTRMAVRLPVTELSGRV